MRWPKDWSFSFSISPSNEYAGLISFRMDWFDLLAVQGTLKSLQHHSSKASILRRSAFFTVQLSHPYTTTGKTIALTRWTFVGKVMSLLFIFIIIINFFFYKSTLLFIFKKFKSSKIWNASRICVSSSSRGHANLLCIIPISVYVLPKRALALLFIFYLFILFVSAF